LKLVAEIPTEIMDIINKHDKPIGRRELASIAGINEQTARYYLRLWNSRLADSDPRTLGMQEILRERVSKQAKAIKNLQKELATEQIVIDKLREFITVLDIKSKPPTSDYSKDKIDVREAITIWSDWHAGEVIDPNQIEGLNEYNMSIMAGRVWNMVRGIIRIIELNKSIFNIDTLNIDMLGDFVSGVIHDELLQTNEMPILQTVMSTAYITAQAIAMLVPHFLKIRVTCLNGNHGRVFIKPQFKNKALNNYDTLIYHITSLFLSKYIDEGIIEFNIPQSSECIIVRANWAFLLGHSDHIRGWSGIPWYGFQRDNAKQQKIRKLRSVLSADENDIQPASELNGAIVNMKTARSVYGYDYRECGHWHTMSIVDDWTTVINGALCGTNEFSLNKLHAVSQPTQTLAFVSEKYGLKGIEPIYCIDEGHNFNLFKDKSLGEYAKFLV
jgi:uncharacterized coiled-coil protein SlyX